MKREDLSEFNLSDEAVQKIMNLHGADIEKQKQTIATLTAERDGLQTRLEEANGKLEGYDPDWKTKAEQAKTEAENKIKQMQKSQILKNQIDKISFSSESAKKAFFIDLEEKNLPLEDGTVIGFDDFVKKYKESDPGAFMPDKPAPTITIPGQGKPPKPTDQSILDAKYKNNPFYKSKGE